MGRLFAKKDSRAAAEQQAAAILQQTEATLETLLETYNQLRDHVWHMPIDARQFNRVLNQLGTDGPKVLRVMRDLATLINVIVPNTLAEADVIDRMTVTETNGELSVDNRQPYPGPRT